MLAPTIGQPEFAGDETMSRTVNAMIAVIFAIAAGTGVGLYAASSLEKRRNNASAVATSELSPLMSSVGGTQAARVVTDLALSAAERI